MNCGNVFSDSVFITISDITKIINIAIITTTTTTTTQPDGVQRNLIGEIIARFEKKGFKLVAMKYFVPSKELAETHYAEHKGT